MSEPALKNHLPECYVKMYVTVGCSRLETSFTVSKEVRVLISINCITSTDISYKNLFQEFYRQLLDYKVIEFASDIESIPYSIQNQFKIICDQVASQIPKLHIVDIENNKIFPLNRRIPQNMEPITRFVENRLNATREIIVTEDIPIEHLDTSVEHKIINIQQVKNTRASQICKIDDIVNVIYKNIKSGKSKNPDFSKKTKAQYRKIKNYVYNMTRVNLSSLEIKILAGKIIPLLS